MTLWIILISTSYDLLECQAELLVGFGAFIEWLHDVISRALRIAVATAATAAAHAHTHAHAAAHTQAHAGPHAATTAAATVAIVILPGRPLFACGLEAYTYGLAPVGAGDLVFEVECLKGYGSFPHQLVIAIQRHAHYNAAGVVLQYGVLQVAAFKAL